jgi:hypothetical protein
VPGATGATGPGATVAPSSIVIVEDPGMGTGNLSTTGTLDWWAAGDPGGLTNPSGRSVSGNHYKKTGGWINKTLSWFNVGAGFSFASGTTFTCDPNDDGGAVNTTGPGFNNPQVSGSQVSNIAGAGLTFRVPAVPTPRVCRIFSQFGPTDIRVTAQMSDGSTAPVSLDIAQGAKTFRITYQGTLGSELIVTVQQLIVGTPGFLTTVFGGITLGTV